MSRILMIEDHPTNRKLIGDILRRAGHDVREATTADEGIPIAIAERPDLIVMDIQLPGTDGLTATRLLRANLQTRNIPVLAVTAHAMRGDEKRILAAGCDGYVAKPISYQALLAEVTRLTEEQRSPVTVVLEDETPDAKPAATAERAGSTSPSNARVLVVDDEPRNTRLLEALLVPSGYDVRIAASGAECLALARDADLILLDAMMPGLDGFEVVRRLREDPTARLIPIVMVTALNSADDRLRALEAGCDEFLSKPFDKNEVLARVRTLVRLNYYRRQLDEKAKLESVVRRMSDGILICDANWKILVSNETAAAYLGIGRGDAHPLDLLYHAYDVTASREEVARLAYRRTTFELRRAASDRFQELVLEATVEVLRDVERAPSSVIMTLRDVTAAYRQGVLRQEFLSLVSHKLRTPLTVISLNASLLLEKQFGDLSERQVAAASAVDAQALRLRQLVEKLITFTLMSDPAARGPSEPVRVSEHVPRVVDSVVKTFADRPVDVTLRLSDVRVAASVSNLTAIVENLVDNAVKFCEKERAVITITAVQQGEDVVLTVEDNGPGIPPEEHASVFEKFYQIEKHFTGSVDGVGLGLPLVKTIVEAYGGRIQMDSRIGSGTKFVVTLPSWPTDMPVLLPAHS
jgi:CheY-like chemotaxis protein/two-component sensor histidine kinase